MNKCLWTYVDSSGAIEAICMFHLSIAANWAGNWNAAQLLELSFSS